MEIPKYIVFRVDVMRKGTSVELTNITDEVEDVIFKADRKTEQTEHRDCINCESADDCAKCRGFTDEPQTVRSNLEPFRVDEPQTDCAWRGPCGK